MTVEEKYLVSENNKLNSGISFHGKSGTISFEERKQAIIERIKIYYGLKLGREIGQEEAKEIADNLLQFAQAIYGA